VGIPRRAAGLALVAASAVFAVAVGAYIGTSRYDASQYLLLPGVDPVAEQKALLAFNQGAAQFQGKDLEAAEKSFQESLGQWEKLTKEPKGPPVYRANLALTVFNLACIRDDKQKWDEAEAHYARPVSVGEQAAEALPEDRQLRQALSDARTRLGELRAFKAANPWRGPVK